MKKCGRLRAKALLMYCLLGSAISVTTCRALAADPVTGTVAVAGLQSLASSVIDKGTASGEVLIAELGSQMQAIVDRIRKVLGDQITKPVTELNESLQRELTAARFTIESLQAAANSMPACVGNEANLLVANVKSGISSAIGSVPFTSGQPIAYLIQQPETRSPFTVTRDRSQSSPVHVVLQGANLWDQSDTCDMVATATPLTAKGSPSPTALKVNAADREKIDLTLPVGLEDGSWLVSVEAKVRRPVVGCLLPKSSKVAASMAIRSKSSWVVSPALTPVCKGYKELKYTDSDSCTNGSITETKSCTRRFQFREPGYALASYTFELTSGPRRASVKHERSGDDVIVYSKMEKKKVGGGSPHVAFRVTMIGRKDTSSEPQAAIQAALDSPMGRGSSKAFAVNYTPPQTCSLGSWVLGGSIQSSGQSMVFPEVKGDAEAVGISTFAHGIVVKFNGLTRRGTVQVANSSCLGE